MKKTDTHKRTAGLFCLLIALLALNIIFPGNSKATDLPVIHKSGTLTADETWTAGSVYVIDSTVTVPSGVTLTVSAGTIVKNRPSSFGLSITNGGSLNVSGLYTNPAVFTSYEDDSYGGDSNNNGASAGTYNDYYSLIQQAGGAVHVSYAAFESHGAALTTASSCSGVLGMTTITDSTIGGTISMSRCTSGVDFERNYFEVPSSIGLPLSIGDNIDVTGVVLSGINKNTFNGNIAQRRIEISGVVPTGKTWAIGSDSNSILKPYAIRVDGTMLVGEDVLLLLQGGNTVLSVYGTLEVSAGAIFKVGAATTAIAVPNGGTLDINGQPSSHVIFTSEKDDSYGGDTNDNGASVGGTYDYTEAIALKGGSATINYVEFMHGNLAIGTPSNCSGSLGALSVVDSSFRQSVSIYRCLSAATFMRNTFNVVGANEVSMQIGDVIDVTGVKLSGTDKNIFSGTQQQRRVEIAGIVPSGQSWTVDGDSNVVLKPHIDVDGTLNVGANAMLILQENALTIDGEFAVEDGSILKINSNYPVMTVSSGGSLNFNGSNTSPVIVTSYKDDSAGGDSNNDGLSSGSVSDYSTAIKMLSGSSAQTTNTVVRYANLAFDILGGQANLSSTEISNVYDGVQVNNGTVTFRGTFDSISHKAVSACSWSSGCTVDAAYSYWDGATPFPSGESLACGQVTVSPWDNGSGTSSGGIFNVPNCDGSDTPDVILSDKASDFSEAVGNKQIDCSNGFQDACSAMSTALACLNGAINVAASTTPFPLPGSSPTEAATTYVGDLTNAASIYVNSIESTSVSGFGLSFASNLVGTIGTLVSIGQAYDNCAP